MKYRQFGARPQNPCAPGAPCVNDQSTLIFDEEFMDLFCHLRLDNDANIFTSFPYIDGLVQESRKSIANALELRLSCANPSIYSMRQGSINCLLPYGPLYISQVVDVNIHCGLPEYSSASGQSRIRYINLWRLSPIRPSYFSPYITRIIQNMYRKLWWRLKQYCVWLL